MFQTNERFKKKVEKSPSPGPKYEVIKSLHAQKKSSAIFSIPRGQRLGFAEIKHFEEIPAANEYFRDKKTDYVAIKNSKQQDSFYGSRLDSQFKSLYKLGTFYNQPRCYDI